MSAADPYETLGVAPGADQGAIKAAYLRLMREVEQDWQKPPAGDYHRLAQAGREFYLTPKPRWESLHPMIGLAERFRVSGDDAYRQSLVHWWRSIYRTDVHNSGSFSTNEQAGFTKCPSALREVLRGWRVFSYLRLTEHLKTDGSFSFRLTLTW